VKTLTKKKKEKDNGLTDLELIHLKNISLLQYEELRRMTIEAERKQLMEDKEYQKTL